MDKIKALLVLILLAPLHVVYASDAMLTDWRQPHKQLLLQTLNTPQDVLTQLLSSPPLKAESAVTKAQYYAVLSRAYFELSYPVKSYEQVRKGLKGLSVEQQPWLYHQLKLFEAEALSFAGKPSEGLPFVAPAKSWAQSVNNQQLLKYAFYTNGKLSNNIGDSVTALNDFQIAYDIAPQSGALINRGQIARFIGMVYAYRDEHELALPFLLEAVQSQRDQNNAVELSIALFDLGGSYMQLKRYDVATQTMEESLHFAEVARDEQGVAYAKKDLAAIAMEQGQLDKSDALLQEALEIFSKSENPATVHQTYLGMAVTALKADELDPAGEYFELAYQSLYPGIPPSAKFTLDENYATYLAAAGDYKKAFKVLNGTVAPKEQHHSNNSTQQLHVLRSKYELDEKARQFEMLEQKVNLQDAQLLVKARENTILLFVAAGAFLMSGLFVYTAINAKRHRKRLEKLESEDGLSGLLSRIGVLDGLSREINNVKKADYPLTVAIINVDDLRRTNDLFENMVGDKVIQELGSIIKTFLREGDIAGRVNGDEFLMILPNAELAQAEQIALSISASAQRIPVRIREEALKVSLTIGLCQYDFPLSTEAFLKRCNQAMSQAKMSTRGGVFAYDSKLALLRVNPSQVKEY